MPRSALEKSIKLIDKLNSEERLISEGLYYMQVGKLERAEGNFNEVIRSLENKNKLASGDYLQSARDYFLMQAYFNRAHCCQRQGKNEFAIKDFTAAHKLVEKGKLFQEAHAELFSLPENSDQINQPSIYNKTLVDNNESKVKYAGSVGNSYQAMNEFDKAIEAYEEGIKDVEVTSDTSITYVYQMLAACYQQKKNFAKAEEYLLKIYSNHPKVSTAYLLAKNYQLQGDHEKSKAYFEKAIALINRKIDQKIKLSTDELCIQIIANFYLGKTTESVIDKLSILKARNLPLNVSIWMRDAFVEFLSLKPTVFDAKNELVSLKVPSLIFIHEISDPILAIKVMLRALNPGSLLHDILAKPTIHNADAIRSILAAATTIIERHDKTPAFREALDQEIERLNFYKNNALYPRLCQLINPSIDSEKYIQSFGVFKSEALDKIPEPGPHIDIDDDEDPGKIKDVKIPIIRVTKPTRK